MPSHREYTPGSRSQRYRKLQRGEYTKERAAWVNTFLGQAVLFVYPEGHVIAEATKEPGPTVKVLIPRHKGPTVHWDLTALTMEELDMLREFFRVAFDTAEPIVRERDRMAQDALAEGNDSFSRVYRQVPQLVVRPRTEREHGESVLDRSEDVPESDTDGRDDSSTPGGVRGPGGELADDGTSDSGGQDDGA